MEAGTSDQQREAFTGSAAVRSVVPSSGRTNRGGRCPQLSALVEDPFSSYDIRVGENEVNEQQIQNWADEAENGYDAHELKRRGRGRPGRGTEPMQVVAVRLTADELAALDAAAEREHLSRSEAIRQALARLTA